ncbi:DUF4360 domain-containing protein [Aetokthonos hydrillicola Thurmond2011]|jgi:hypothetical protein|uniref:DUF4360 domain-containing protein n=1 Tax=Aetokthonos hydrillicola Thurmond2011 TaxID=2712845 RepID=A0AAP5I6U8_9CYAN|nr:DUF4360 domain-containing protein [Aetokthonos hydrillicola]MBO3458557.1 DUF4360 domain-containing protein [Aetokthonos hydrillicola CCALA 1050]MBW4585000.1 DUF4360 domain-containing protein [Aetokthonos hydrillicola CCALA 1050]MDR9894238.1 DUF4360 domain-containing protein [Aetokthonos hydrillicola Thurmond2011]
MTIINTIISSVLLVCINLVGFTKVQAEPQRFQFKSIPLTIFGNGCPSGNLESNFNGDTLAIKLPQFQAVALHPKVVSKSCNLRIGLNVPSGYKVRPVNLKYIGFANVPQGGSADLKVRIVAQGKNVPTTNDPNATFGSKFSGVWKKNIAITPDAIDACTNPVDTVFGINTVLIARARTVAIGQQTQLRIDKGYEIKFTFTPC